MTELSKTKKAEIAFTIHQEIVIIKKELAISFLELSKRLHLMFVHRHFIRLGYESWAEYLATPEITMSVGTASKLIGIYEELILKHGFSKTQLREIEWSKLAEIIPIVRNIEKKSDIEDWIKKAEVLSQRDLRMEVKELQSGIPSEKCDHDWTHREFWKCKNCDLITYQKPYNETE